MVIRDFDPAPLAAFVSDFYDRCSLHLLGVDRMLFVNLRRTYSPFAVFSEIDKEKQDFSILCPEGWRLRRMETLRDVIKGPTVSEDWHRANEEYLDLKRGYSEHDDDFGY